MRTSIDPESSSALGALLRREYPLVLSMLSMLLFAKYGNVWLSNLHDPLWFAGMLGWLLTVILMSAFAIVRHAESLAELLGEPFGTLVLTLSIIGVEVLMISAVMLSGDGNPTMARDTMFSVVMILLGGIAGVSLLVGGLKHHEQSYNLEGARTFLALIIPLAVLGLILPNFTTSTSAGTLSAFQSIFLSAMSLGIYGIFLGVQTSRHSDYFTAPAETHRREDDLIHGHHETRSTTYHAIFLLLYILPMVLLAKKLALPLEYGTDVLGAPDVLNGFVVALLILAPEAMSAVKAALNNQLQRAVNILLGSVLATIGLTVPAVLMIGLVTESTIMLGLSPVNTILLALLLSVSTITFSNSRTNAMLGAVHILMFAAYLMLMFDA
ncbi:calcium:proton antiporter [Arenimonas sp.]|jgi:Ca2+:H+ antiporter|uniref:calcium:proton antiporter n=1 Tax=Arenimonas sp. TaxID=1872635 RepID=UPI0037C19460